LPLKTALSNANNEAKLLSDQLEIKSHSLETLHQQMQELQEQMSTGDLAVSEYLDKNRELENALKTSQMQNQNLEEKIESQFSQLENFKTLETTVAHLQNATQEQLRSIDQFREQNGKLETQLSEKEKCLEARRKDFGKVEEQLKIARHEQGTLQAEVERLRSTTSELQNTNDDLRGQLLRQNIERAKELAEQSHNSLATEMNSKQATEEVDSLKKQLVEKERQVNEVQAYLDKVLGKVLERDPEILEIL